MYNGILLALSIRTCISYLTLFASDDAPNAALRDVKDLLRASSKLNADSSSCHGAKQMLPPLETRKDLPGKRWTQVQDLQGDVREVDTGFLRGDVFGGESSD
jgi:hypothetical protein